MVKKVASYKVDENVLKEFNEVADKHSLNKSKWVENVMRAYIAQDKISIKFTDKKEE